MDLPHVASFDSAVFTKAELAKLRQLADRCAEAASAVEIEAAGAALDKWRAALRVEAKVEQARARSRNALYKRLVFEVPRRTDPNGDLVAAPDRKAD